MHRRVPFITLVGLFLLGQATASGANNAAFASLPWQVGPHKPQIVAESCRTRHHPGVLSSATASSLSAASTESLLRVSEVQGRIEELIRQSQDPAEPLRELEVLNGSREPNREARFLGEWHVWYTNCPPPSNGQLGPFRGTSSQVIQDAATKSYKNLLAVPPNRWLTATLDGVWDEWDGILLDTKSMASETTADWGAAHWKVTFVQLQIVLFGLPIFTKPFEPETCRIWRTTYLDDEIRIVRAGRTGRADDEYVFYTRRTPAPS